MRERDARALGICLAASVLLHAAVLLLAPGWREGKSAPPPAPLLTARLAPRPEPPRVQEAPKPVERPVTRSEPAPPQPAVETPRPVLSLPPQQRASDSAPAVAPPPVAASPSQGPASIVPPAPSAQTAAPAPRPASNNAPAAAAEASDAGTFDRYRLSVIAAIKALNRPYPRLARERGWQGITEVRVVIGANGLTRSIEVKNSSGFPILDKSALELAQQVRDRVALPPALSGREVTVDLPISFVLRE